MAANDEQMTIDERCKYLKWRRPRYGAPARAGRSELVSEMEAATGLDRKSLPRLLHAPTLSR